MTLGVLSAVVACGVARAEIAVSANDAHSTINKETNAPPPDTLAVIDLAQKPPKVIATIEAPTSVNGPPMAVAVARDESFAIVSAANKPDPANPGKAIGDDEVSVVDLASSPPKVIQRAKAGVGAAGVITRRMVRFASDASVVAAGVAARGAAAGVVDAGVAALATAAGAACMRPGLRPSVVAGMAEGSPPANRRRASSSD